MPARRLARWSKPTASLAGSLYLGTICLAEDSNNRLSRLGFAFDQRAHDLAVAATNAESSVDARDSNSASDDLLHLPKYVVTEKRVPLKDREILTPKGRLEIAKKAYLTPGYQKTFGLLSGIASLLINPLGGWQPNNPEAMALYEDNEQLRRKTEMQELLKKQQR